MAWRKKWKMTENICIIRKKAVILRRIMHVCGTGLCMYAGMQNMLNRITCVCRAGLRMCAESDYVCMLSRIRYVC